MAVRLIMDGLEAYFVSTITSTPIELRTNSSLSSPSVAFFCSDGYHEDVTSPSCCSTSSLLRAKSVLTKSSANSAGFIISGMERPRAWKCPAILSTGPL